MLYPILTYPLPYLGRHVSFLRKVSAVPENLCYNFNYVVQAGLGTEACHLQKYFIFMQILAFRKRLSKK